MLSAAFAAPLFAEEPALRPVESPPLLLETGEPASAKKDEPANHLPVWTEGKFPTIENAFDLKRATGTEPPSLPSPSVRDIGELLSPAPDSEITIATVPTKAFRSQLAQLERAASEASNTHSLGRLAASAEALAVRPALSEAERSRAEKLASWAYLARGRRFAIDGKKRAAFQDFDRAVRLTPQSTSARLDRAISLAEQGEAELALQDLDRVLALAPDWPAALSNRAALLFGMEQDERALSDCDNAIQALRKQKKSEGLQTLQTLQTLLTLRGRVLHRLGRHNEAIADFDEAIRRHRAPSLYHLRGNVFAEIGFYEQAINDYLSAVRADPSMAEAYRSLAWVLATCPDKRLRNPATAVEAAWRARRLGSPGDPMMLDASAAAHASAGDFDKAIRLQQRALVAASSSSTSRYQARLDLYRSGRSYVAPKVASLKKPSHRTVVPANHESATAR